MNPEEQRWSRRFGALLVVAPIAVAVVFSAIAQQPRAAVLVLVLFIAPMALGAWLLFRKHI